MLFSVLAIFAVLAIAVACGDDDSGGKTPAAGGTTAAPTKGAVDLAPDQTLKLNLGGEPDTLDPSKASFSTELTIIEQLFRGPFKFDKDLKLAADMAEDVPSKANKGISDDGLTYQFKLKSGLKWSDGQPITAAQVAYAIKRSADPRFGGDYANFYQELKNGDKLGAMKPDDPGIEAAVAALGVETPDERTVKLTLAKPNAEFVNYLALWMTYPLREDVIKAKGDKWIEAGNMVSSGPFVLKEWQHKDHITLASNPNWYGEKVTLTQVTFLMIEDANQAFNAYLGGQLDQVGVPTALVPQVKVDPAQSKELVTQDRLVTYRFALTNTKAPFDNKKVRQAFAYAIDRKTLVDVALKGVGKPATSFTPPGIAGYDANAQPQFDANKAKQLLADAGFPNGQGLPKITFTYANAGNNPPIATFLQEALKNVLNVSLTLEPVDSKTFQAKFKAGEVQMSFVGWGADYPDAGNFMGPNLTTGAGNNKSGYSSKQFDDLVAKSQLETDRTKAAEILKQAQTLMQDDSPDLFIFYSQVFILRKPWVKGIFNTGMDHQVLGDRNMFLAQMAKH
jgi:oligopeptide transport system substrate-binding protein